MVPHTFLDGIWYSIGHPLHAKLTCQAQKVVQFFFPHLCLPEVDEVHHSCQGGVSESPHEDDRVRLVNLEQQVFEERTRGSEDHPVGIEPLSIFTDQSDIRADSTFRLGEVFACNKVCKVVPKACVYSQFSGSCASLEGANTLNLPFPPTLTLTLTAKLLVTLLSTINLISIKKKV